jgi:hypothetical protein
LETTTIDRGVFTVARRQLQPDCSIALALIIGGGLSNADVKRRFGRVRLAMLWLHSFEEPFYSVEELERLAAPTLFHTGQTHFWGALCCLVLKKETTTPSDIVSRST